MFFWMGRVLLSFYPPVVTYLRGFTPYAHSDRATGLLTMWWAHGPRRLGEGNPGHSRPARGQLLLLLLLHGRYKKGRQALDNAVCRSASPAASSSSGLPVVIFLDQGEAAKVMASNYVDATGEEGTFRSTTPTGAAASSPRAMRRSFSSASSGSHGGGAGKCVCAPATHAGSFKCRFHRTNSQGHGHPHPSPPVSPAGASAASPPESSPASSQ